MIAPLRKALGGMRFDGMGRLCTIGYFYITHLSKIAPGAAVCILFMVVHAY